jgi:hypothetical protein
MQGGDGGEVIVAGRSDQSPLVARISLGKGEEGVMPARGEPLNDAQIAILRAWIDQGAPWSDHASAAPHWSYVAPRTGSLPSVRDAGWVRTPIDMLILTRLEQASLAPSPPAAPEVLVRRLFLDLVGLPPTLEDVESYVADRAPDAYERLVDRLLASPQFGVRWARPWLDYARYADSHGFQRDDFRDLWAYRDWVVSAFNDDMPFDRFTIEQLAGDLLPDATDSTRIASGFNRNAPTNVEAGSDPEETRVNQVFDRVNTLGMVWLGTTLECCQCHDHKYDPFTQRDYYGLFSFLNQTAIEAERSNPNVPGSIRFLGPDMPLPSPSLERERMRLTNERDRVVARLAERRQRVAPPDADWESSVLALAAEAQQEHVLEIAGFDSAGGATHEVLPDRSVLLSGEAPDHDTYTITVRTNLAGVRAFKLEALTDPSLPGSGPGRGDAQRPNFVLNTFSVSSQAAGSGTPRPVVLSRAMADFSQPRFDVSGAIDADPKTAWAINPRFHVPHWAIFETPEPVGDGTDVVLTFRLEQNFGASRTIGRLRLCAITGQVGGEAIPAEALAALRRPVAERSPRDQEVIAEYRLRNDADYQSALKEQSRLEAELQRLAPSTTLVMRELEQPRTTRMFVRGDFRQPGERVEPATPAVLHPLADVESPGQARRLTRLELARWLVDRDNPLTARVVVNRWWSELFGHGLVTTSEDFGVRGEPPSHPELLDWLAVRYMNRGWSLKELLREIVISAAYRQSSRVTPELLARDDRNLLYARGPRLRLDAEAIRDNALSAAGVLSLNQGGPSIRPYQPEGMWIKVGGQRYEYVLSPGEMQYRRGLYVVWKRAAPYPSFVNFDANNRMACRVQRPRSNTPLQALTLLNDPVYVEAAGGLARRVLDETPGRSLGERLEHAFRTVLARRPKTEELAALRKVFDEQLNASRKLFAEGTGPAGSLAVPTGLSPEEFSAWYAVAAVLLNLDETITKG